MLARVFISTFLSINLYVFTEEHGTAINEEKKKNFKKEKILKCTNANIAKIAAQAFEARDILNIFFRFGGF